MPDTVDGMLTCPNSNCITATEPVETSFRVSEKEGEVRLWCKYCEKPSRGMPLRNCAKHLFWADAVPPPPGLFASPNKTGKGR